MFENWKNETSENDPDEGIQDGEMESRQILSEADEMEHNKNFAQNFFQGCF